MILETAIAAVGLTLPATQPITSPYVPFNPSIFAYANPGSTVEHFSIQYYQAADRISMKPEQTHVCVLNKIGGNGGGANVYVDEYGQWVLERLYPRSFDDVVGASCFPKSVFSYAGGGTQTKRWNSGQFHTTPAPGSSPCSVAEGATWWSDAATMLQGLKGPKSQSMFVIIGQEANYPNVASRVSAYGCAVEGYASSFFVGIPGSGQMAKFHGPLGIGTIGQAGSYHIDTSTSYQSGGSANLNSSVGEKLRQTQRSVEDVNQEASQESQRRAPAAA
jgi:hypothetical protein